MSLTRRTRPLTRNGWAVSDNRYLISEWAARFHLKKGHTILGLLTLQMSQSEPHTQSN